jgi:hypothetical protein
MKMCFIARKACDEECKAFVDLGKGSTCIPLRVLGSIEALVLGLLQTSTHSVKYPASAPAPEIKLP